MLDQVRDYLLDRVQPHRPRGDREHLGFEKGSAR